MWDFSSLYLYLTLPIYRIHRGDWKNYIKANQKTCKRSKQISGSRYLGNPYNQEDEMLRAGKVYYTEVLVYQSRTKTTLSTTCITYGDT